MRAGRTAARPDIIHICADDMRFDDFLVMPDLTALATCSWTGGFPPPPG
jgi:hypothetical protein